MKRILPYIVVIVISIILVLLSHFIINNASNIKTSLAKLYDKIFLPPDVTTDAFPCNEFKSKEELEGQLIILSSNDRSEEQKSLEKYVHNYTASDIFISPVGSRCDGKFQFKLGFDNNTQKMDIEKILIDQKLNGVPVYLFFSTV